MVNIEKKVMEIIAEQMGVEATALTRETDLKIHLGADSLDGIEIVMDLENEYGIDITDEDAKKMRTVGDIADYIRANYKPPK